MTLMKNRFVASYLKLSSFLRINIRLNNSQALQQPKLLLILPLTTFKEAYLKTYLNFFEKLHLKCLENVLYILKIFTLLLLKQR